jgi:hypothetical protein
MREDKQVLAKLVKQGTVGDDIWTEFTLSEKEIEQEIMAIVAEANTFKEGWGQTILQTASEIVRTLSCLFLFLWGWGDLCVFLGWRYCFIDLKH